MTDAIAPLRDFVCAMTELVGAAADEARLLVAARTHLARLIARDDWLADVFAAPRPDRYAQYLLHADALERFSVVSFVWSQGQQTPVHNHTVWGLVGVMRGEERCDEFSADIKKVNSHDVRPGDVDRVSPRIGDVHVVSNAGDKVAVSIHVYGANIGAVRRHTFDPDTGAPKEFISGYHNTSVPNLWDRSKG